MRFLFLDIDGVLNDHTRTPSGYSGIQPDKVVHLNRILSECPDVQLVISSAWRYAVLSGKMTLEGFELMLLCFGVRCFNRIHGVTQADGAELGKYTPGESDEEEWRQAGIRWRSELCEAYVRDNPCASYAIIDDLELDSERLIKTDGTVGLTAEIASLVVALLEAP